MELKKVLTDIVCSIVDKPEEVQITEEEDGDTLVLVLNVAPDDMGKVIGKHGRIAKAIRLVIKAAAAGSDKESTWRSAIEQNGAPKRGAGIAAANLRRQFA